MIFNRYALVCNGRLEDASRGIGTNKSLLQAVVLETAAEPRRVCGSHNDITRGKDHRESQSALKRKTLKTTTLATPPISKCRPNSSTETSGSRNHFSLARKPWPASCPSASVAHIRLEIRGPKKSFPIFNHQSGWEAPVLLLHHCLPRRCMLGN